MPANDVPATSSALGGVNAAANGVSTAAISKRMGADDAAIPLGADPPLVLATQDALLAVALVALPGNLIEY